MSTITAPDTQLGRLAEAIAQRVGQQRFHVWFNNSTRLNLKHDLLEISVPNDFISEMINRKFRQSIQEAAAEVLGGPLAVKFLVMPQLFEKGDEKSKLKPVKSGDIVTVAAQQISLRPGNPATPSRNDSPLVNRPRLRHDLDSFIVGGASQLAFNAAKYVAEFPGAQYNPLFIHGNCGLGKTHLLQGVCKKFTQHHPTKRWAYMTGEDFTNEFLTALRANKLDIFRRKMRDLDLLVIDDVHFLSGKKATQEEFLHTFNAIEASGRQVVMASDNHPKMIEEFGESLVNRFVSGMVVRIDPPNFATRCEILRAIAKRTNITLSNDVVDWVGKRVTQNVRELEGAVTRIAAYVKLTNRAADLSMVQQALSDLDRQHVAPVKPETIMAAVCSYFGLEQRELMSGRRQRTVSLARSVAMYLVRKTAKLSFPEIGAKLGRRNHSTVISACRRIEKAVAKNESLEWSSAIGERNEEAVELIQRLEEHCRTMG